MSQGFNDEFFNKLALIEDESREGIVDSLGGEQPEAFIRLKENDYASEAQKRMIFALGRNLGLEKDGIKYEYGIDSIANITFGEARRVINDMQADINESESLNKKQLEKFRAQSDDFKWTMRAGVNFIGNSFAKCGHCGSFSGEVEGPGECKKKIKHGSFPGTAVHPMMKDCFSSRFGELKMANPSTPSNSGDEDPF